MSEKVCAQCTKKFEYRGGRRFDECNECRGSPVPSRGRPCASFHRRTQDTFVVDHDHSTGSVRGLLCNNCNIGIGMLGDKASVIRAAAAYIESHQRLSAVS